jgi:hypothetical protein
MTGVRLLYVLSIVNLVALAADLAYHVVGGLLGIVVSAR